MLRVVGLIKINIIAMFAAPKEPLDGARHRLETDSIDRRLPNRVRRERDHGPFVDEAAATPVAKADVFRSEH
jgi:hypothetical protein